MHTKATIETVLSALSAWWQTRFDDPPHQPSASLAVDPDPTPTASRRSSGGRVMLAHGTRFARLFGSHHAAAAVGGSAATPAAATATPGNPTPSISAIPTAALPTAPTVAFPAALPASGASLPTVSFTYEDQTVGSNTVTLYGNVTGATGTTVEIFSGATDLGAAVVDGTTWSFADSDLTPGNYSFTAIATTPGVGSSSFTGNPSLTVGAAAGTRLDILRFHTVWQQDFTQTSAIDASIFPIVYGNANQFAWSATGLTLSSYQASGWTNVGFLQPDYGTNPAQGYGLYSVTASHPANQGGGIAILLWPDNNVWPGPEMDLVEDWLDPTGKSATFSVHFKSPTGQNMANVTTFAVDLSQPHTYSLDWEAGSLTYYLDSHEILQITGTEVPADAAHGGINAAFGAQVSNITGANEPTSQVSLDIYSMSYSLLDSSLHAGRPATDQPAPIQPAPIQSIPAHTAALFGSLPSLVSMLTADALAHDTWPAHDSSPDSHLGASLVAALQSR